MLVALLAALLTALPIAARAANNPGIVVSNLSLVASDSHGVEDPTDTNIRVEDILKLSFTWDARNANVSSGDSFQITLPAELQNRESITEDMTVTNNGATHTIGSCVMDAETITCTFNDELDALKAQGFSSLQGSGSSILRAAQTTDQSTVTINANGQDTPVAIPGGKIGENIGMPYSEQWLSKWAYPVTSTSTEVTWEVTFGSSQVKQALENAGSSLAVDGTTRSTITFTDELSPGQTYSTDMSKWRLVIGNALGRNYYHGQVTDATGADQDKSEGDFDIAVQINGNAATVTVTGPFAPDTNYHIYYSTNPTSDNGTVQPGVEYTNKVAVSGTSLEDSYSAYYTRSFAITVEMAPGFGGMGVTKLLTGDQATQVPAGTTFEVTVDYVLPSGATVDTYAGWTPPGTVNADRKSGSTTMTVTSGEMTPYTGTFPTGTVLTLREDTATASTTPDGVVWGTPVFTVGSETTNTLTVKEQTSTAVILRNSADTAPVEEGDFTITKELAGDGDFTGTVYTFSYSCSDSTSGTLTVEGGQTSAPSQKITAGSFCTIIEDEASAARDGYSVVVHPEMTVQVVANQTTALTATNTYTRDSGTFSVAKVIDGDFTGTDPGTVTVNYQCDDPTSTSGSLVLTMGGSAVSGPTLPAGTTCVLSEDAATAERDGYTVTTSWSQESVTIVKDSTPAVTVTNTYTPIPTPSASPSEEPSVEPSESPSEEPSASESASPSASADPSESGTPAPVASASSPSNGTPPRTSSRTTSSLARTGAFVVAPLVAAAAALAGGVMLLRRRRG
ncbi:MAG: DUF5979 domain-containing protein [Actinomyces sp.]|uniref:DUF7926 domain-containing protein n=1 Tax=Actinomyces sp. TaxID=29317 RepID=UPI0026DC5E61|nr:DUF5979 domain-containing protein [Actinomyces sp.]MDO4243616.1 DUF5979 domain-containing protein [Actinomyces sp.]